jgi:hypothetical protein
MGAVLFAAGSEGKRFALPNSRVMIHQPWGGVQGTAADITIQADEIAKLKKTLNTILGKHTGKTPEQIEKDSDRDYFLSAQEAKDYGLVDEVIDPLSRARADSWPEAAAVHCSIFAGCHDGPVWATSGPQPSDLWRASSAAPSVTRHGTSSNGR